MTTDAESAGGAFRVLRAHLGSEHVGRVIYGAIIGLALVVVMEVHPPSAAVVAGSLVGTGVAVALAEAYSEFLGAEARYRRRVDHQHAVQIATQALAVGFGTAFPAVIFVLAEAGAIGVDTAFVVAKWSGVGLIGFYGFCAGRLAGSGVAAALVQALAVAIVGALLIALKALLH